MKYTGGTQFSCQHTSSAILLEYIMPNHAQDFVMIY